MLTICSVPISSLYFLYTSEALGVRFGMWGWCLDEGGICSGPLQYVHFFYIVFKVFSIYRLGYTWEPQLSNTITNTLVFYPISSVVTTFHNGPISWSFFLIFTGIAAVSIILTLISLIPVANARSARTDRVFLILAWISFASSIIAFSLMIGIWSVAKDRFQKRGFGASYGPLVR